MASMEKATPNAMIQSPTHRNRYRFTRLAAFFFLLSFLSVPSFNIFIILIPWIIIEISIFDVKFAFFLRFLLFSRELRWYTILVSSAVDKGGQRFPGFPLCDIGMIMIIFRSFFERTGLLRKEKRKSYGNAEDWNSQGLMLYRDGILWKNFFENLGYQCIVSEKSGQKDFRGRRTACH